MSDLARASALCDIGRYEDALPFAQRAVAADPADPEPHCVLASALYHLDRYADALQAAERAIGQDPNQEWPHRIRALSLLGSKKKRAALQAAREAVRLGPDLAETHHVLVQTLLANHRLKEAKREAEECLALRPDSALGHNAVAIVMLHAKKWRLSEEASLRALAIDPESSVARHNLGIAVSRQRGRTLEGVSHLTEASKLNPNDPLSREQAVAVGRRYAVGGFFVTYLLLRLLITGLRTSNDSAVGSSVFLLAFVVITALVLVRRRRRLQQLPEGVAELIRRGDVRLNRRTGKVLFWGFVAVAGAGAIALVSEPRAGLFLLAVGGSLALVTRRLTRTDT
jgi:tetratricopeptide (TPR) repeat protein